MRLLLAEGEEDLAEALGVFFEKNYFLVDIVHDGRGRACPGDGRQLLSGDRDAAGRNSGLYEPLSAG